MSDNLFKKPPKVLRKTPKNPTNPTMDVKLPKKEKNCVCHMKIPPKNQIETPL